MNEISVTPLKTERSVLIFILSCAFLIKLILLFLLDPVLRSDSLDYQTLANSLLNGEYSLNGKPTAYVGIGYPAFLSGIFFIFGEGQFYVRLVQSVIEAGTALLFYGVSRRFFSIKHSLISVAIFSFFPSNILYSQTILSEPLFGFFSMAVLYLFLRDDFSRKPIQIFVAGLIFGLAVLIRTAYLPICILVPLFFYSYREEIFKTSKVRSAVIFSMIFFMGMILVIAPWSIRNKMMVGTYSLGTTSGLNFWLGSNPDATGSYFIKPDDMLPGDYSNEADRDKEYFKLGLDYAVSHPVNYMILGIKKIGYLYSSERMIINYFKYDYFNRGEVKETSEGSYADRNAPIKSDYVMWNHSLSDVINNLIKSGLEINSFEEYDYSVYDCFNKAVEYEQGRYRVKGIDVCFPMMFSVTALKK